MIQLAGHLKGRGLQEWNLWTQANKLLLVRQQKSRLGSVSETIAAQDFRHTTQHEAETVSDFIRRLKRTFLASYGRDKMSVETRAHFPMANYRKVCFCS